MLKLNNYNVAYGQSRVINDMNLEIGEGEIISLVGRNGMGKTTLLKSLIGMVPQESGQILLDGEDISAQQSHERVASGIGFVPQGRMIFSTMTVTENIVTGLTTTGEKKVPEDLYDLFPVLKEMGKRRGGNLSGGQQQQLAIARALASRPKLLVLDEPTEGIQPSIIREMAQTLRRIRDERGLTILVSEQVLSFALDVSDKVMVIEKGDIVHQESSAEADQKKIAAYLSV
ncbi:MAG: urea ABC transporter ATP-binding subunit UrtE [Porticoccaceae bacterium]|jgi:urea transport system ATP-binding protein|nr:urea ABC transporter ATP-binding subunit UrtE [Cellvibrionales bacterium]MDA8898921.1 urea ABC transporter ATP-binding subunit UrtE [Porticoccaceae bacterium]MDB3925586.1 urea ABC transporter ATP-binding subunit UrtE [Porticoccaceae bacterium]